MRLVLIGTSQNDVNGPLSFIRNLFLLLMFAHNTVICAVTFDNSHSTIDKLITFMYPSLPPDRNCFAVVPAGATFVSEAQQHELIYMTCEDYDGSDHPQRRYGPFWIRATARLIAIDNAEAPFILQQEVTPSTIMP